MKLLLEYIPLIALLVGSGGGGLALRFLWQTARTLERIEGKITAHDALHDEHKETREKHDDRIADLESAVARHSGILGATRP